MSVWKGGRGSKTPYESTHVRVPIPIKEQIEAIVDDYRQAVLEDESLLTRYQVIRNNTSLTSLEKAKKLANKYLRSKVGKWKEVARLLSDIYQTEVTVEDLERSL